MRIRESWIHEETPFGDVMRRIEDGSFLYEEDKKAKFILKMTRAVGDLVIASAVKNSLKIIANETLKPYDQDIEIDTGVITKIAQESLWYNACVYNEESEVTSKDATIIDISDYLTFEPFKNKLLRGNINDDGEFSHLSEWMMYSFSKKTDIFFPAPRDLVMVSLTKDEVKFGIEKKNGISNNYGGKPVVVISPYSTTLNRNIPEKTLDSVVSGISDFAVPLFLEKTKTKFSRAEYFPTGNYRDIASILFVSDAAVVIDSALHHIINAVLQGTPLYKDLSDDINTQQDKVVLVVGSSRPEVVSYRGNRIISGIEACEHAPCGYFGYAEPNEKGLFSSRKPGDNSKCHYRSYYNGMVKCMQSIPAEKIVETVKQVLKK